MLGLSVSDAVENSPVSRITADGSCEGSRLDVWLEGSLPGLSRSRIQALIRAGRITVDGQALKPHSRVHSGMTALVEIPAPAPVRLTPEAISLDILYEDADVIVVNKPAGLVVHPAAGHATGTLVHALLHHCGDLQGIGGERRPGIVHRLDKDTSGAMVAVKNEHAMLDLVRQFRDGSVEKEYLALVAGVPEPRSGTVETLIGRNPHDRKKMTARPAAGRRAVTDYAVEDVLGEVSLLKIRIHTGRTHQIRVHMAHLGHPVIGDRQYGRRHASMAPRQMLHARRLAFRHPRSGGRIDCTAPVPADMRETIERFGNHGGGD